MNSSGAALLALRAIRRSSLTSSNTTWTVSSRSFAAQTKDPSKSSAGGGGATSGGAGVNLQGKNLDPPGNVYKQVDKAALGPGASKESDYKNPEYFSYHNMSYTEMELVMAKHRVPQPSNRK